MAICQNGHHQITLSAINNYIFFSFATKELITATYVEFSAIFARYMISFLTDKNSN